MIIKGEKNLNLYRRNSRAWLIRGSGKGLWWIGNLTKGGDFNYDWNFKSWYFISFTGNGTTLDLDVESQPLKFLFWSSCWIMKVMQALFKPLPIWCCMPSQQWAAAFLKHDKDSLYLAQISVIFWLLTRSANDPNNDTVERGRLFCFVREGRRTYWPCHFVALPCHCHTWAACRHQKSQSCGFSFAKNKLASLEATLVRNYDSLTYWKGWIVERREQ